MEPTAAFGRRYRAFIAYSHRDEVWAKWLQGALESYRVPRRLVGTVSAGGVVPRRLMPVFRDRDELPSASDLSQKIDDALKQSANLIIICSPAAAASRWVNEEVRAFKRLGRARRIFCLIVAGEPNASALAGREAEECFPHALRFDLGADEQNVPASAEPIAADVRMGMDGKPNAKLKLIAGLLDIGLDDLKHREHQRRVRRFAAATATASLVMIVTVVLAISAVLARHAAERHQREGEKLIDFMLGDLNVKLSKVQRLDLLEAVDDQAMAYFKSLPSSDVTGDGAALQVRALTKIGTVRLDQGHLSAAMDSFQAAAKLAGAIAEAAPADVPRQVAYADVLGFIGMTDWRQRRLDAAEDAFESAERVLGRAQANATHDSQLIYELVTVHNNTGHVLEARGNLDAAEQRYRRMLDLCQQLVAIGPQNTTWSSELGAAHNNLGKLALLRGDLVGAVAEYAADDAIESALSAKDPNANDQRESMLTVRAILGRTLALAGEVDMAMRDLQQAVDIAKLLEALDADNSNVTEDIGLYAAQLGRLKRLTGDFAGAQVNLSEALTKLHALTLQDPANAEWQRELAEVQNEQAALARDAGHPAEAQSQARAALTVLDPLAAQEPDDRAALLAAVTAQLLVAATETLPEEQRALRERALQTTLSAKSGLGDPRLMTLQVEAMLALARPAQARTVIQQLWKSGYRDPALVVLLNRAGIDYPVNSAFRERLQAVLHASDRPLITRQ
jgi:eukaryotic-like serine/threonine-protein kinase